MHKVSLLFLWLLVGHFAIAQSIIFNSDRQSESEISVEDMYIAASQKKLLGKYEEAIMIYNRILESNEVNASVHHDLARMYSDLDDPDKAISSARKAVRYDQSNYWYLLTLADIYEKNLRYTDASKTIADVLKLKKDEGLYHRYAQYLDLAERKAEAIKAYDQADALYGWSEYRSDSKVDLYLALDKKKEAANEVKKWTQKYPNNIEYWTKLARYYEFRGEGKNSKKAYEKVLSLDVTNEEALFKINQTSKKTKGESGLTELINDPRIGIDNKVTSILPLLKQNNLAEAIVLSKSLVDQYPENAKAHALLGDAHWLASNASEAISAYQSALKINKSIYQVWDQLMLALAFSNDHEALVKVAEEALDYYPNQSGPYYYSALCYGSQGNVSEAMEYVDEALFIAEAGNGYIKEQSQILKATLLDSQNKTEEAIDLISQIENHQNAPALSELLGDLFLKIGDKASAEKAWKNAISKGGDRTRIEIKIQSI